MNYSIGQFSNITNVNSHTLRYYEKEQLLTISRDSAGRRFYTKEDVDWILFIKRLKETGMSIKDIREYALLRYQGNSTMAQRLKILEKHKMFVIKEKNKWENNLENLNDKIKVYKNNLSELVQLKLNIGASDGDSTPPEARTRELPLVEVGVLRNG